MSDKVTKMMPEAQRLATISLAEGKVVSPMISSMDFTGMGKSTPDLIAAVTQTNLRAVQELLSADNPKAMLEVQQRFACEYAAVLMQSIIGLIDAIESAATG